MTELTITTVVDKDYFIVSNNHGEAFEFWKEDIQKVNQCGDFIIVRINNEEREVSMDGEENTLKIISIDGTEPDDLTHLRELISNLRG